MTTRQYAFITWMHIHRIIAHTTMNSSDKFANLHNISFQNSSTARDICYIRVQSSKIDRHPLVRRELHYNTPSGWTGPQVLCANTHTSRLYYLCFLFGCCLREGSLNFTKVMQMFWYYYIPWRCVAMVQ